MGTWVNFAEIRERVSLEDVLLRYYRLEHLKRDGSKLVGPCPVHVGDSPRAFHADLGKNTWFCFSQCKKGGNQIDLVAAKEKITVREAALRLQSFFFSESSTPPPPPAAPPVGTSTAARVEGVTSASSGKTTRTRAGPGQAAGDDAPGTTNPPLDLKLDLKADHPHLLEERHLRIETVNHFGVGYCSRGILKGTIAIPIHDEDGDLVAYAGRRLKSADIREHGKYRFPRGFKKDLVLYELHRAKTLAPEQGLILVEGFFSVMALHQAGLANTVAAMGSSLSEAQAALLSELATAVVILYDGDEAGWSGGEAAQVLLTSRGVRSHFVRLPAGVEPEDLEPRALRWLVNGVKALDLETVSFTFRGKPGSNG